MIRSVENLIAKRKLLEELHKKDEITWVVSDLKSKAELEKVFLEKKGYLESENFLRISEFWNSLFFQVFPEKQIIDESMCKTLAQKHTGSASSFYSLKRFLPLFTHPDGEKMFYNWIETKTFGDTKLLSNFKKSKKLWIFLEDKGLTNASFIPALLVNLVRSPTFKVHWPRKVYFDLGSSLTPVEGDFINGLKSHIELEVLEPEPRWRNQYHKTLFSYELLKTSHQTPEFEKKVVHRFSLSERVQLQKHSSCLSEVQSALTSLKKWNKKGVDFSHIALLAPRIEEYWPVLNVLLKQDRIPVHKKRTQKLSSLPGISRWLCHLKVSLGLSYAKPYLEGAMFSRNESPMNYFRFKQNYSHVYSQEDLKKNKKVSENFSFLKDSKKEVCFDEFIKWSLDKSSLSNEVLDLLLTNIYNNLYEGLKLSFEDWFSYLEDLCSDLEITLEKESEKGVNCENVFSAENLRVSHVFVLGTSQSFLETTSYGFEMNSYDLKSLYDNTGFILDVSESVKKEFELAWLLDGHKAFKEIILSCPSSHFSGTPLEPSHFWLIPFLNKNKELGEQRRNESFFSQFQNKSPQAILQKRTPPAGEGLLNTLLCDEGKKELPQLLEKSTLPNINPTSLKQYGSCPFKWAARYLFHLEDRPQKDLSLSPIEKGRLSHKILEEVVKKKDFLFLSHKQISTIINDCLSQQKIEGEFRKPVFLYFLDLVERFLKYEKDLRQRNPKRKTIGLEVKLQGAWSVKRKHLVKEDEASIQDLPFKAIIDRIDKIGEGRLEVLDYKNGSSTSYTNAIGWSKKREFQLWLYTEAVNRGLLDNTEAEAVEAYYYTLKDFKTTKGLNYERLEKKGEKESFDKSMKETFSSLLEDMREGHISPQPLNIKECNTCLWRKLCRAHHLKF